jgi:hypothetical protein
MLGSVRECRLGGSGWSKARLMYRCAKPRALSLIYIYIYIFATHLIYNIVAADSRFDGFSICRSVYLRL